MMFVVFGKLIKLAFKATWGITKIIFTMILLPILLICMVLFGLVYLAIPILVIIGIAALIGSK